MTTTADLQLVSKVAVAGGTPYAVTAIRVNTKRVGPSSQTRTSYEEVKWDLDCLAEVSSINSITALNDQLRTDLVAIGSAVTLTEMGTARTLPASGVGGSMIGFPKTEITDIPDKSFGPFQAFTLSALSRIPIVDEDGIIEHTTTSEEITNIDGTLETSVSGSVIMEQDRDARAYVMTNIIGPARTAASAAGKSMTSRTTVGDDTNACVYSYSIKPSNTGTADVTEASVEDKTTIDTSGRRVRTISGYAKGAGASDFADAQIVAETASLKLIRQDGPSLPSIPDGRVSFSYQYASGVEDASWPGIYITKFRNPIRQVSGGDEMLASAWLSQNPDLRLGRKQPFVYSEGLEIEFIGDFDDVALTHQFTNDNIVGVPSIDMDDDGKLKTVRVSWTFMYPSAQTLPSPRSVIGVSAS